jgi:proprotein convertase subtilisin/kexin type 5
MPARTTLQLSINIPPEQCRLAVSPTQVTELSDKLTFSISGCIDRDLPLKYAFKMYLDQTDYDEDLKLSQASRSF